MRPGALQAALVRPGALQVALVRPAAPSGRLVRLAALGTPVTNFRVRPAVLGALKHGHCGGLKGGMKRSSRGVRTGGLSKVEITAAGAFACPELMLPGPPRGSLPPVAISQDFADRK